jgi:uncharacterized protein
MNAGELPLFPLSTVLFPGGPLSLRIFETRYLDLVRRCLRESAVFGVVLIRDGAEAGAVSELADCGTAARLVDFDSRPDGLLGVRCLGEQRFRIQARRQQSDGLHLASVEWLAADGPQPLPPELARLAQLLSELLPRLPDYSHCDPQRADAGWVANRWAELLPLSNAERQALLELDDPLARVQQVAAWAAHQGALAGA